jgi:hypothetical protein
VAIIGYDFDSTAAAYRTPLSRGEVRAIFDTTDE